MIRRPALTPLVAALPPTVPFVGPEAQERDRGGRPFRARIGANESSFGPAPSVIAAMRSAAPDMWMYCDPDNFDLKTAVAAHLGVGYHNVVVGEGIDGLLNLVVRMMISPGMPVVTSLGAYPTFNFHVAGFGGRLVAVPYENDRESLDGLLAAVKRENAPLVYLSNPDNPMGTWWEAGEIMRFIEALPATTMLVIDEAYGELGPATALTPIDVSRPNVLWMRTFSKAYGLAGIRCGYAIGEETFIRDVEKIRNHYGVNRMALVAGEAALADQAYLDRSEGQGCRRPRPHRANRARQRAVADPVRHQLRHHRLRRGRRLRAPHPQGADRARRLHPQADGAGPRPLHPRQRRPRPRTRHLRRGTAEGGCQGERGGRPKYPQRCRRVFSFNALTMTTLPAKHVQSAAPKFTRFVPPYSL